MRIVPPAISPRRAGFSARNAPYSTANVISGEGQEGRRLDVQRRPEHRRIAERLEPERFDVIRQRRPAAEHDGRQHGEHEETAAAALRPPWRRGRQSTTTSGRSGRPFIVPTRCRTVRPMVIRLSRDSGHYMAALRSAARLIAPLKRWREGRPPGLRLGPGGSVVIGAGEQPPDFSDLRPPASSGCSSPDCGVDGAAR